MTALILTGCAGIPPAVTIATTAIDGVSWLASGKTMTDHAISEVVGQDCRLIGILEEWEVCKDRPDYELTVVATLKPLPETGTRGAARQLANGDRMVLSGQLEYLPSALEGQELATAAPVGTETAQAAVFAPVQAARGFLARPERVATGDDLMRTPYLASGLPVPTKG
jgi:hypothetical protein